MFSVLLMHALGQFCVIGPRGWSVTTSHTISSKLQVLQLSLKPLQLCKRQLFKKPKCYWPSCEANCVNKTPSLVKVWCEKANWQANVVRSYWYVVKAILCRFKLNFNDKKSSKLNNFCYVGLKIVKWPSCTSPY
jgi:hypothetical protein